MPFPVGILLFFPSSCSNFSLPISLLSLFRFKYYYKIGNIFTWLKSQKDIKDLVCKVALPLCYHPTHHSKLACHTPTLPGLALHLLDHGEVGYPGMRAEVEKIQGIGEWALTTQDREFLYCN